MDSEACFWLARQWVKNCSTLHNLCRLNADSILPKRFIDAGSADGSEQPRLCTQDILVNPDSNSLKRGKYAALSCCWGLQPFLTCASSTIKDLLKSIPIDTLPQTVRDAIVIVRKLGIQYLWVDALCILQGSHGETQKDWEIESEKMADIYSRAFLTILAALASSAHDGVLQSRANQAGRHCLFPYKFSDGSVIGFVSVVGEPLDNWAWVYQEHEFSTRILRYGTNEMSWKCKSAGWNETKWDSAEPLRTTISNPMNYVSMYNWMAIVTNYSSRKLTRITNKLTALAGIATAFQAQRGGCFIAGMWYDKRYKNLGQDLLEQLLRVRRGQNRTQLGKL